MSAPSRAKVSAARAHQKSSRYAGASRREKLPAGTGEKKDGLQREFAYKRRSAAGINNSQRLNRETANDRPLVRDLSLSSEIMGRCYRRQFFLGRGFSPIALYTVVARPSPLPLHSKTRAASHAAAAADNLADPRWRHIFRVDIPHGADRAHALAPDDAEFVGKYLG
jgi:hypothetical protein